MASRYRGGGSPPPYKKGSYMENKGFMLFRSYLPMFKNLSAEEIGELVMALYEFFDTWEAPEIENRAVKMAFDMISGDMISADERWKEKSTRKAENGKKGAEARWQTMANDGKNSKCHFEDGKNGESKSKSKGKSKLLSNLQENTAGEPESAGASPAAPEPADCEAIPLNDGSEWTPTREQFEEFERLYPALDVRQKFRDMRAWSLANPSNRKTRTGVLRFVTAWLTREQNRAPTKAKPEKRTRFDNFESHGTDYDAIMWAGVAKANGE